METVIEAINKVGQKFVDDPVYINQKPETQLSASVRAAFGDFQKPKPILIRHDRVRLRWMEPDGKGGMVPRKGKRK